MVFGQLNGADSTFRKQFDAFKTNSTKEFNAFRQHNDSVFLVFLSQTWKEFHAVKNKMPSFPKPENPPVYKTPEDIQIPTKDTTSTEQPLKNDDKPIPNQKTPGFDEQPNSNSSGSSKTDALYEGNLNPIPDQAILSNAELETEFIFFGVNFNIPNPLQKLPVLSSVSQEGVIKYFSDANRSDLLNNTATTLKSEATECGLNDWGLAYLFMKAAQKMYPDHNNQVMFTWFSLLHAGFNVKIGYNKKNVFLLLPSKEMLYGTSFTVNGRPYNLINFNPTEAEPLSLFIREADYPESISDLSFMLTKTPKLSNVFTQTTLIYDPPLVINVNRNLADFYSNYPACELKIFFNAPLSENAINQLDAYFIPVLKNKNDDQRVAYLLNFVQKAIRYQTDAQQFGHEKYLFADETLFYSAADCEDRSIFLAKLITRYTNCKVIGLSYPGHVSLAVNLISLPKGKFIEYKNLRYYHCDPTYINALCGEPNPTFENMLPKIIDLTLK